MDIDYDNEYDGLDNQEEKEENENICEIIEIKSFSNYQKNKVIVLKEQGDLQLTNLEFEYRFKLILASKSRKCAFAGIVFHNQALNLLGLSALDFLLLANKQRLLNHGFNLNSLAYIPGKGLTDVTFDESQTDEQPCKKVKLVPRKNIISDIVKDEDLILSLINSPGTKELLEAFLLSQRCKVAIKSGKQVGDIICNSISLCYSSPGSCPMIESDLALKLALKHEMTVAFPGKLLIEREKERQLKKQRDLEERESKFQKRW